MDIYSPTAVTGKPMDATRPSGLYYPNRIVGFVFQAMDDVMGQGGLNALLGLAKLDSYIGHPPPDNLAKAFDFADLAALSLALEEMYGIRGGRGMALRVGRAAFSRGMKTFGALAGVQDPAFRQLARDERCQIGLQALAQIFNRFSDQKSTFREDELSFHFIAEPSPIAWGRTSEKPVCHLLGGMITECLRWASNGHEYYVFESTCRACGDARCTFSMNKTPIG
jgi:hypothetical protein